MKAVNRFKILFVFSLLVLFVSCENAGNQNATGEPGENITVSAAISLKDAFNEIGAAFEKKTGGKVNFNYGASGALQRQIETGAPVDVFASAGERQMNELERKDLINRETRRDFAANSLVLVAPQDSKLKIENFADLSKPDVKKIAVGNPKTVPAGQYAEESLKNAGLQNALGAKLILAENVRQVLDYVARGEADAGIVYATDASIAKDEVKIVATAEENTHSPILYPLAVIKNSENEKAAREFADFVLSAEGLEILRKYGFKGATEK